MDDAPKEILENACRYLRKEYGRPETEFARRILTVASKCIGTDNTVVLTGKRFRIVARNGTNTSTNTDTNTNESKESENNF